MSRGVPKKVDQTINGKSIIINIHLECLCYTAEIEKDLTFCQNGQTIAGSVQAEWASGRQCAKIGGYSEREARQIQNQYRPS